MDAGADRGPDPQRPDRDHGLRGLAADPARDVTLAHGDGIDGAITDGAFLLTLIGFFVLTVGGWLGGAVVFTYGMRVLNLVEEPAHQAVSPVPEPEEKAAEK